jgi:hypothetical protein
VARAQVYNKEEIKWNEPLKALRVVNDMVYEVQHMETECTKEV